MLPYSPMAPWRSSRFVLVAVLVGFVVPLATAQPPGPPLPPSDQVGLSLNDPQAFPGYSLVAPMNSTETYLIDMEGRIVNTWKADCTPAMSAYLLENGNLLRPGTMRSVGASGPGAGGRIQEFSWDGELLWDFTLSTERYQPHHDICPMPNGNVLVIAWDRRTPEETIAAGRRPELVHGTFLPDCILEIRPTGKTTGEIVWQWHAWDHLVQDVDRNKPNYGDISENPQRIDINYSQNMMAGLLRDPEQLAKLRALGYVGGGARADDAPDAAPAPGRGGPGPRGGPGMEPDWMHTNSIDYNAELDQIMLSVHSFNEVWIIDHGTTTAEAASSTGGRRGRGGDLLYRWGNPRAYRNGTNADQRLFAQHNAHWIPAGLPGAGNMLVFNNGGGRPDGLYSSVDEIVLPLNEQGLYTREEYLAFGPERAIWSYTAPDKTTFFSMTISGAHRLPNGNTFICSGNAGILFEVTPDKETVWRYTNPNAFPGGMFGPGGMSFRLPRPGEVLPEFLREQLEVTQSQKQQLAGLQEYVDAQLEKILTNEQQAKLEEIARGAGRGFGPPGFGPPGFGPPAFGPPGFGPQGFGPPGGGAPGFDPSGGGPAGFGPPAGAAAPGLGGGPDGGPRGTGGTGGPEGRRGGGPGGGPGRGPGGGPGGIFRCYRYAADFPGLAGKDLTPGEKLDDVVRRGI